VCIVSLSVCSCSGYDFGYLLKLLTANELPAHDEGYFELLSLYFPQVYDVKVLMKSCSNLRGGLQEVAESLEVRKTIKQSLLPMYSIIN